jgi:hypothetical protein
LIIVFDGLLYYLIFVVSLLHRQIFIIDFAKSKGKNERKTSLACDQVAILAVSADRSLV